MIPGVVNLVAQSMMTGLWNFSIFSLSGFLICFSGGPISWKPILQNQTALRSYEDDTVETNECTTETQSLENCANNLGMTEAYNSMTLYNNNQAWVQWAASVT